MNSALEIKHLRIGTNKGKPRLYIDSARLRDAGMDVGSSYNADYDMRARKVTLTLCKEGDRVVCRKRHGDDYSPLIDIQNSKLGMFGADSKVIVTIRRGVVEITIHHNDARAIERVERLAAEIEQGQVTAGELCIGAGIMADALHTGFQDQGIALKTKFVVEIDPSYLATADRQSGAIDRDTLLIEGGIQEIDPGVIPRVSVLVTGLPCTGASLAGRAKRHLKAAEEHPDAGYLVAPLIQIIHAASPSIVLLENVTLWENSASCAILTGVLREWGYKVQTTTLTRELGAFENRKRLCLVATTPGLDIDLDKLLPVQAVPAQLDELLEPVPADSPLWKEYAYLAAKETRDIANGAGFRTQVLTPTATSCGTITRGYNRVRSTDPRLAHPTNPKLSRLFTPVEHARIKGIPERFVEGLGPTEAHEVLGQSVLWPAFRAVGRLLAATVAAVSKNVVRIGTAPARKPAPGMRAAPTRLDQLDLFAFA